MTEVSLPTRHSSKLLPTVHSSKVSQYSEVIASKLHINQTTERCKVFHPKIVFFIRIPKSASTSFVDLLKSLAASSSFTLLFNPSGAYDWDDLTARKEASLVKSKNGKVVYARHFYYIDFETYGVRNFTYVAVIRDPVARFVSSYLYYHYSSKRHIQRMLKPEHKHESLLECTARRHNGCSHNWLTKYFCGHHKHCTTGGPDALAMAKANMLHKFAVIGVLEEIDLSMKVFSAVLPGFFTTEKQVSLPVSNKNEQSMVLSTKEQEVIQRANAADIELYAYARDLLHAAATLCNLY